MNFLKLVSEWDAQIRAGQGAAVFQKLQGLPLAGAPPEHRPALAALCRRLGAFQQGLELLRADYFAHRHEPLNHEALMTEYAALLTEVGATGIADRILSRFVEPKLASTFFYRGLLGMKNWEHGRAVEEFKEFRRRRSDRYWTRVAHLNSLACHISLREFDKAAEVSALLESQRDELSRMAQGNLSELQGQMLFLSGKTEKARAHFVSAAAQLASSQNPSLIYAEKWIVLADLVLQGWAASESSFMAFHGKAFALGFWEVVRELERFRATQAQDEAGLAKVYFGSPMPGYKTLVCRDAGWSPPAQHALTLGQTGTQSEGEFNVQTQRLAKAGTSLPKLTRTSAHLLKALTSDLYRPLAMGSIFEQVYPGAAFDPAVAADRVHQTVHRLRELITLHELGLEVELGDYGYQLKSQRGFTITYLREVDELSIVARLRQTFADRPFSTPEVARVENISARSVARLLAEPLRLGELEKVSAGRFTRYRLKRAA